MTLSRQFMRDYAPTGRLAGQMKKQHIKFIKELLLSKFTNRAELQKYMERISLYKARSYRQLAQYMKLTLEGGAKLPLQYYKKAPVGVPNPKSGVVNPQIARLIDDSIVAMHTKMASTTFPELGELILKRNKRATQQGIIEDITVDLSLAQDIEAGKLTGDTALYKRLSKGGLKGQVIKAGKKTFDAQYYANLVARTRYVEAHTENNIVLAQEYDTDLMRVSEHNTKTDYDRQFEGRIFSISGNDSRFPMLTDKPPFHPNCLHFIMPVFADAYTETQLKNEVNNEPILSREELKGGK